MMMTWVMSWVLISRTADCVWVEMLDAVRTPTADGMLETMMAGVVTLALNRELIPCELYRVALWIVAVREAALW